MSLSLTPRSLKRKLLQVNGPTEQDDDNLNNDEFGNISDISSQSSPLTLHLIDQREIKKSPLRLIPQSYSPARNGNNSCSTGSPATAALQMSQLNKIFASRPVPFPLELLKTTALTQVFLEGRALEGYFQRRNEEITQSHVADDIYDSSSGLRPLQRPFVRSSAPSVPFTVYLERLFRYCHPEALHLLAIVAYSERLIKVHGIFVPLLGMHRFVVAAWIVAGKALLGDQYWTHQYWARVAGIPVSEICSLEIELVNLLEWRLQISSNELSSAWFRVQL